MLVYLLRHAIAEEPQPGKRDSDRALTEKGIKKLRGVLERAVKAEVRPSRILTSPYLRARQTAEIAAQVLGCGEPLVEIESLVPGSSPERVWDDVRIHRDAESLLLSGHEPLMSMIYAHLLGSPSLNVQVKKASLGCIELESLGPRPRGVLHWLITPGI